MQEQKLTLAEQNRLRELMGLAPISADVTPSPDLSDEEKASQISHDSPLGIFNAMYGGEGPSHPTGTVIHWWGQFSDELPVPFCLPNGGHGWIEAETLERAAIAFGKLRQTVLSIQSEPGTENPMNLDSTAEWAGVSEDGSAWYRWMLPDATNRQMTVEFKTRSQLDPRDVVQKLADDLG